VRHPLDDLPIEFAPLHPGVAKEVDVERRRDELLGIDPRIDRARRLEAADEQTCSDQKE
jgi:hypothetical protein